MPQHIYLADDTVAANIAFGLETKDINEVLIEKAAKIANLHQFVIDELPNQYQTIVGENGVRLSGGQRQRIGIARALYLKPKILVLDESTNELDSKTENEVINAIRKEFPFITIVMITHRLSSLKLADNVVLLKNNSMENIEMNNITNIKKLEQLINTDSEFEK